MTELPLPFVVAGTLRVSESLQGICATDKILPAELLWAWTILGSTLPGWCG